MTDLLDIRVRAGLPGDVGYVIDSWGRSLRNEYPDARTTDFVGQVRGGIKRRLDAGARIFVAHPAEDVSLILGWCCIGDGGVHYVYVRHAYRLLGVARKLIEQFVMDGALIVGAMTADAREIKRTHPGLIRYFPNI